MNTELEIDFVIISGSEERRKPLVAELESLGISPLISPAIYAPNPDYWQSKRESGSYGIYLAHLNAIEAFSAVLTAKPVIILEDDAALNLDPSEWNRTRSRILAWFSGKSDLLLLGGVLNPDGTLNHGCWAYALNPKQGWKWLLNTAATNCRGNWDVWLGNHGKSNQLRTQHLEPPMFYHRAGLSENTPLNNTESDLGKGQSVAVVEPVFARLFPSGSNRKKRKKN